MGGLGAKKEELVPNRSALRKEKGAWKAEGEDPGCRKDLESGGRSQRSESCVEMNASDGKGWYPKAAGNPPDFLLDCPGAATSSWREGEPSAAGRARVSAWNNQVGRKLSSCWSLSQPQRPAPPQTVVYVSPVTTLYQAVLACFHLLSILPPTPQLDSVWKASISRVSIACKELVKKILTISETANQCKNSFLSKMNSAICAALLAATFSLSLEVLLAR